MFFFFGFQFFLFLFNFPFLVFLFVLGSIWVYYCVVGLGLGPRNRIDDGFDIGKKTACAWAVMWDPHLSLPFQMVGPISFNTVYYHALLLISLSLTHLIQLCSNKLLLSLSKRPANNKNTFLSFTYWPKKTSLTHSLTAPSIFFLQFQTEQSHHHLYLSAFGNHYCFL